VNQRNVEALYVLIQECLHDIEFRSRLGGNEPVRRGLAERLASRGVLVPASLTEEDRGVLEDDYTWVKDYDIRLVLERIARGD
jgi:hypothetical protein